MAAAPVQGQVGEPRPGYVRCIEEPSEFRDGCLAWLNRQIERDVDECQDRNTLDALMCMRPVAARVEAGVEEVLELLRARTEDALKPALAQAQRAWQGWRSVECGLVQEQAMLWASGVNLGAYRDRETWEIKGDAPNVLPFLTLDEAGMRALAEQHLQAYTLKNLRSHFTKWAVAIHFIVSAACGRVTQRPCSTRSGAA